MPVYKDLSSMFDAIKKDIDTVLNNEVYEAVKELEILNIRHTVYDVYKPKTYKRRYTNEGMLQENNIIGEVKNGKLSIINATKSKEGDYDYLPQILEYGYRKFATLYPSVDHPFLSKQYDKKYAQPRPFTQNTHDDLVRTKIHYTAFKQGMSKIYKIK